MDFLSLACSSTARVSATGNCKPSISLEGLRKGGQEAGVDSGCQPCQEERAPFSVLCPASSPPPPPVISQRLTATPLKRPSARLGSAGGAAWQVPVEAEAARAAFRTSSAAKCPSLPGCCLRWDASSHHLGTPFTPRACRRRGEAEGRRAVRAQCVRLVCAPPRAAAPPPRPPPRRRPLPGPVELRAVSKLDAGGGGGASGGVGGGAGGQAGVWEGLLRPCPPMR
jgi:hypothetical protein